MSMSILKGGFNGNTLQLSYFFDDTATTQHWHNTDKDTLLNPLFVIAVVRSHPYSKTTLQTLRAIQTFY